MAQTEHAGEISERSGQIRGAEENPAQQDNQEGDRDPQRPRKIVIETFPALAALEGEHAAVQSTPDDKIPRRAVPESAEQHGDDQIEVSASDFAAVAAERNVEVFAQPGRKRDVPAPPEIGDRFRAVGRIEIFREDKAEHEAEPDRHVRVTAEVEINLERVPDRAKPRVERADRAGVESRVRDFSARIREQDFFREAEHEEGDAAREFVRSEDAMFELVGEKGEFQDRPRDEVREHGNETGKIDEVRHRLGLAAINVDRVAERLKGVEADAERQHDAEESVELSVVKAERRGEGVPALSMPKLKYLKKPSVARLRRTETRIARRCVRVLAPPRGSCFTGWRRTRQNRQVSCAMTRLISQSTNVVANMSGMKRGSAQP